VIAAFTECKYLCRSRLTLWRHGFIADDLGFADISRGADGRSPTGSPGLPWSVAAWL